MEPWNLRIGDKIKACRRNSGLSLPQLAKKTGIAASNLSAIELNKSSPTIGTLLRIATAFGVPAGDFLNDLVYEKMVFIPGAEGTDSAQEGEPEGVRHLTAQVALNGIDVFLVAVRAGGKPPVLPGQSSERFILCLSGTATVESNAGRTTLRPRDGVYVFPEAEITVSCDDEDEPATLLVVTGTTERTERRPRSDRSTTETKSRKGG
jgi:transcriptional regulator with XRE-family HTH domain